MRVKIESMDDSLYARRAAGDRAMSLSRKTAIRLFEASVIMMLVGSGVATLVNMTDKGAPSGERHLVAQVAQSFEDAASHASDALQSLRSVPPPMADSIQIAMAENVIAGRSRLRP